MNEEKVSITESLGMLNTYSAEIRSKIDALVKQVLLLSAGVQAITIGAFLNGTPPKIAKEAVPLLQNGWIFLSLSIVLCLAFMLSQIIAMVILGFKLSNKIKTGREETEIMTAPMMLRVSNCIIGISAFLSCAVGIVLLSLAAISLIHI